jgi:hypothetical protein
MLVTSSSPSRMCRRGGYFAEMRTIVGHRIKNHGVAGRSPSMTGRVDFAHGRAVDFGMVVVGLDYRHAGQIALDEITGG